MFLSRRAAWLGALFAMGLFLTSSRAWADRVDDLLQALATTDSYKVRVQVCLVLGKTGEDRKSVV